MVIGIRWLLSTLVNARRDSLQHWPVIWVSTSMVFWERRSPIWNTSPSSTSRSIRHRWAHRVNSGDHRLRRWKLILSRWHLPRVFNPWLDYSRRKFAKTYHVPSINMRWPSRRTVETHCSVRRILSLVNCLVSGCSLKRSTRDWSNISTRWVLISVIILKCLSPQAAPVYLSQKPSLRCSPLVRSLFTIRWLVTVKSVSMSPEVLLLCTVDWSTDLLFVWIRSLNRCSTSVVVQFFTRCWTSSLRRLSIPIPIQLHRSFIWFIKWSHRRRRWPTNSISKSWESIWSVCRRCWSMNSSFCRSNRSRNRVDFSTPPMHCRVNWSNTFCWISPSGVERACRFDALIWNTSSNTSESRRDSNETHSVCNSSWISSVNTSSKVHSNSISWSSIVSFF